MPFVRPAPILKATLRLTSGLHSERVFAVCPGFAAPPACFEIWDAARETLFQNAILSAAPAVGGLIIGHEVARALNARFLFTERDASGKMTLRRGFHVQPGETAVVIEDVVTTGGSTREVIQLLQAEGVVVRGAGSIIDRSGGKADLGVPRVALETLTVTTWQPEDCPLCKQGVPVEKPGSRPTA